MMDTIIFILKAQKDLNVSVFLIYENELDTRGACNQTFLNLKVLIWKDEYSSD